MRWISPITADIIIKYCNRFNELFFLRSGLLWSESFSDKGGGNIICEASNSNCILRLTPTEFNVSSRVHEYGGNSFICYQDNIYFVNKSDQRIYIFNKCSSIISPILLTNKMRFTNLFFCQPYYIFCVCENHDLNLEPENYIALIHLETNKVSKFQSGADFYSDINISSDGNIISWNQWFHPYMPWDESEIVVGLLSDDKPLKIKYKKIVINQSGTSYMQPKIVKCPNIPDSYLLLYLSDGKTGLYNLNLRLLHFEISSDNMKIGDELGPLVEFKKKENIKDIGYPLWVTGTLVYDIITNNHSTIVMACAENDLYMITINDILPKEIKFNSQRIFIGDSFDISTLSHLQCRNVVEEANIKEIEFECCAISSSKCDFDSIIKFQIIKPEGHDFPKTKMNIIHKICDYQLDPGYISLPKEIIFPIHSRQGNHDKAIKEGYAYFYPPKNKDYQQQQQPQNLSSNLPPLIVIAHGGPTAKSYSSLDLKKTQYFTSRGYAVLIVNYRGSFGYGKPYRDALYGNWGIFDVDDCCSASLHVSKTLQLCDSENMFITGSSSGGYTALASLTFRPEVFKAGVSYYGISDLKSLVNDTHKFEKFYTQRLVLGTSFDYGNSLGDHNNENNNGNNLSGGLNAKQISIFDDRSPIYHINKIKAPIAFFHGKDDKVVPPNQSIVLHNELTKKGIYTEIILYENEGHGFRDGNNIKDCLERCLQFFEKVMSSTSY